MNFLTISIFVRIPFIKIPTRYHFTLLSRRVTHSIKYNTKKNKQDFFFLIYSIIALDTDSLWNIEIQVIYSSLCTSLFTLRLFQATEHNWKKQCTYLEDFLRDTKHSRTTCPTFVNVSFKKQQQKWQFNLKSSSKKLPV